MERIGICDCHQPHRTAVKPRRQTVGDVMTREVITVRREADFKEIERVLAQRHVGAVPVIDADGNPVGVVSETDLLLKIEGGGAMGFGVASRRRRSKAAAATAEGLMTTPVITIGSDQSLAAAARLMRKHRVHQLPVVSGGKLVGMLSRGDLLQTFLRADEDIREDVLEGVIRGIMWLNPREFEVSVEEGVVEVAGVLENRSHVEILIDLIRGVEGVVEIHPALSYRIDNREIGFPPPMA